MKRVATPVATPARAQPVKGETSVRVRPVIEKPTKPWADFPLNWHKRGYWKKKAAWAPGGELRYTADAIESYNLWLADERAHNDGQAIVGRTNRFSLENAKDLFLTRQHQRLTDGEISAAQFGRWRLELAVMLPKAIDMNTRLHAFADERTAPTLFRQIKSAAVARGLQAAEKHIVYVRAMLDYIASPNGGRLMRPAWYGDAFDRPTQASIDQARDDEDVHGTGNADCWTFNEAIRILDAAKAHDAHLYAQLVLCALAGYTSADCAALPLGKIDRERKVINFPRVKLKRKRRKRLCPLTVPLLAAIDASLAKRPQPADEAFAHLLFLTRNGTPINESKARHDEHGRVTGVGRKDVLNLKLRRLCERLDRDALKAWRKRGSKGEPPRPLRRPGLGQKTFRAMNYIAGLGAGVDKDFLAVLRGRRFANPIEEYYLRGDLRRELEKLVVHIAQQFKITAPKPPSSKPRQKWTASPSSKRRARRRS
jgi:hypothetical protein